MKRKLKRSFNTSEAARYCHVSPDTIRDWANRGMLKTFRTPGGHRRLKREDLVQFLMDQNMPVDAELIERSRRVLIIDDNAEFAEGLVKIIKQIDPQVEAEVAHSGFDAGRLLLSIGPDLVLLDLKMPGLDGFDVCRQIKGNPGTQHVTVIGMTGYYGEAEANEIVRLGAATCLRKPLGVETVRNAIEMALGAAVA